MTLQQQFEEISAYSAGRCSSAGTIAIEGPSPEYPILVLIVTCPRELANDLGQLMQSMVDDYMELAKMTRVDVLPATEKGGPYAS